jgi:hypothetical protein
MNSASIASIRSAVDAARQIAHADLRGCDVDDIEELLQPLDRELQAPNPNKRTLSSYLNSLARSLRSDPAARRVCLQLDAAMRESGIQTDWEVR